MLDLAPHSRIWIFQADRELTDAEIEHVRSEMKQFLPGWAAHGNELYGDFAVEYKLFLLVGVDEKRAPASGCSIDALTHKIQDIGQKIEVDFFNRLNIAYEDPSTAIHMVNMAEFKELIKKSEVNESTTVYNNLIETVGDLEDKWRTKLGQSWHKNLMDTI